jgi:1,4-alpha-glucan branching enzyme
MGGEIAQTAEWSHARSLDWHLLEYERHAGVQRLVRDLNARYRERPALWERDAVPEGFAWLLVDAADDNVIAFARFGDGDAPPLVCVANLAPVPREGYRVPMPLGGRWREVLNTDAVDYWGGGIGNAGVVEADAGPMHDRPASATMTLPPLATIWLEPDGG